MFARGVSSLSLGEDCHVVIQHPEVDATMVFVGQAVFIDDEGARIALRNFGPAVRAELVEFAARRLEVQPVEAADSPVAGVTSEWDADEDSELRKLGSLQVVFRKSVEDRPAPVVPSEAPTGADRIAPSLAVPELAGEPLELDLGLPLAPVGLDLGAPMPHNVAQGSDAGLELDPPLLTMKMDPLPITAHEAESAAAEFSDHGSLELLELMPAGEVPQLVPSPVDAGQIVPELASSTEAGPELASEAAAPASTNTSRGAVERKRPGHVHERLRGLSMAEQLRMAREGDANERVVLERLYGKSVWDALLRNPRLSVAEVSRIARMGALPRPSLELIANNPAWTASPQVRRVLLSNARLPRDIGVRLLRALPKHELKLVLKQTSYPLAIRNAARKLLKI